jgi:hypothetical protein
LRHAVSDVGIPVGEPKDGDYVAYLAQIEKRQLAALLTRPAHPQPALAGPHGPAAAETTDGERGRAPLSATEAERLRQQLRSTGSAPRGVVGAAVLALFGLFFATLGLVGDGGIVALLIGVFLLWRAWATVRKSLSPSPSAQRDLAARLVDTLRQGQRNR